MQGITSAKRNTRDFSVPLRISCVQFLASSELVWHSIRDLGSRGAGGPSQGCVSTVPPLQTPVIRGGGVNPDSGEERKIVVARDYNRDKLCCKQRGEFTLSFHPGVSVDSPGCSPKKNSPPSNPCSSAQELPQVWRAANSGKRSTSGTWCSYGRERIHTGRRAYCWFARCMMMAALAALSCGPTGAAQRKPGTPTASPRCCGSAGPHFRLQGGKSTTPAISRSVLNVWAGGEIAAGYEYYVNSELLSRHNIRYRHRSRSP